MVRESRSEIDVESRASTAGVDSRAYIEGGATRDRSIKPVKRMWLMAAVIITFVPACVTKQHFEALSSSNVNYTETSAWEPSPAGRVVGRDCQWLFLGVYTLGAPRLDRAVHNALRNTQADLIRDVAVDWSLFFAIVIGRECWRVEGNAYRTFN
jgi:hypothetical protein